MKRFIATLVLFLALVSPVFAEAPAFPFQTYAEAIALLSSPIMPVCENGGSIVSLGDDWRVLTWADRDLFIHLDATGTPDWIYATVGTLDEGRITVRAVLSLTDAQRLYPSGCEYGDERQA